MLYLPLSLRKLSTLTASDTQRVAMTAVRVAELEAGRFRVDATDGRVAAVVRGPSLDLGYPNAVDGEAAHGLVPAADWANAFKLKPPKGQAAVALALGPTEFSFAVPGQVLCGKLVEGRFPAVDGVVQKGPTLTSLLVDARLLARLLEAVAGAAEDGDGCARVRLHFYGRDRPLVITSAVGDLFVDAMLMPLIEPREGP